MSKLIVMRNPLFSVIEPSLRGDPVQAAVMEAFACQAPHSRIWIACSGGPDSMALLHAANTVLGQVFELRVVHVNHGLHAEAAAWAEHVQDACDGYGLPCQVHVVEITGVKARGLEDAARQARLSVFSRVLGPDETVVTAHHREDQAETVLLRLLRGAGPRGLSAMRPRRALVQGWLVRPFLRLSRVALVRYCEKHGLQSVQDPSNQDPRYRRNWLRRTVIPAMEEMWPAASHMLERAAQLQSEANELIETLGALDLAQVQADEDVYTLDIKRLNGLCRVRAANVIRTWLARRGFQYPHRAQIERLLDALKTVRDDRELLLPAADAIIRRYRGRLHVEKARFNDLAPERMFERHWQIPAPLLIGDGVLSARVCNGDGLSIRVLADRRLVVRARVGGERIRPAGRGVTKRVKSLFQEAGIPPWQRTEHPLVYVDDTLVAIPGICIAEGWAAEPTADGWILEWTRPTPLPCPRT